MRVLVSTTLISLAGQALAEEPAAPTTTVEQPRPYGYLVGDVLIQRVLLEIDGRAAEPIDLPRKEKIGVWLLRRSSRIERDADGRRWLLLDYQIVNASKDLDNFVLPALHLRTKNPSLILDVPEWPVTVGAITAQVPRNQGALVLLQADRPAPLVATAPLRRSLVRSLIAFAATLALWAGWLFWRNWRASLRQPFAIAYSRLREVAPDSPEAWRALHRAFDTCAGRVLQLGSLPGLFERAPWLAAARPQIEQFFVQSGARFFSSDQPAAAPLSLPALCKRLRSLEKRNET